MASIGDTKGRVDEWKSPFDPDYPPLALLPFRSFRALAKPASSRPPAAHKQRMTSIPPKPDLVDSSSTSVELDKDVKTYRNIQNGRPAPVHVTVVPPEERTRSDDSVPSYKQVQYRVYLWRWFMLCAVCLLNVSNGMVK